MEHWPLAIGAPKKIGHGTAPRTRLIHARIDVAGFLRGLSLFSGVSEAYRSSGRTKPSACGVRVGYASSRSLLWVPSGRWIVTRVIGRHISCRAPVRIACCKASCNWSYTTRTASKTHHHLTGRYEPNLRSRISAFLRTIYEISTFTYLFVNCR